MVIFIGVQLSEIQYIAYNIHISELAVVVM